MSKYGGTPPPYPADSSRKLSFQFHCTWYQSKFHHLLHGQLWQLPQVELTGPVKVKTTCFLEQSCIAGGSEADLASAGTVCVVTFPALSHICLDCPFLCFGWPGRLPSWILWGRSWGTFYRKWGSNWKLALLAEPQSFTNFVKEARIKLLLYLEEISNQPLRVLKKL